jgi:rare lipoprotein A (peptidoglycan hydrolase)
LNKYLWGTAWIALPVVVAVFCFFRLPTPKAIAEEEKVYPYAFEIVSPDGKVENSFSQSNSKDPVEIGKSGGITVYPEDRVTAFPNIGLNLGAKIRVVRAPEITINDWNKDKLFRSFALTVGDLIDEKQFQLGNDDKVSVPLNTPVYDKMKFKITRVAKTTVSVPKPIDFQVVKKSNSSEEKDYKKIIQAGVKGIKNYFYLVTREDGIEVSRVLEKTEIAKEPVDQIIEVGTKVKVYGSGTATWYKRSKSLVAASNTLPKGTKVNVVNTVNGKSVVVTVDDTGIQGSAIIDLSSDAFSTIGSLSSGVINVRVEKYYPG